MLKKLITSLLILTMVFTVSAAYATEEIQAIESATDIEIGSDGALLPEISSDSASGEFARVLKYKIMQGDENGNLNLTTPVTRAEMAQLVANALLLSGVRGSFPEGEEFTDLPDTHWAYHAVAHAKANGIVNGMGDGTFAPYHSVTNVQAVKMIVATLGYSIEADHLGGYPHGYMNVADKLGITKGLTLVNDSPALRQDIAIMLEKALDVPLMVQTGFGSQVEYTILDGADGNDYSTLHTQFIESARYKLPEQSAEFSYSFDKASRQYSDFVIIPTTAETGIRMTYQATSASHNITLNVIDKATGKAVYSDTASVLEGFETEFWLSFTELQAGGEYYIELSKPSIAVASGTFKITG